MSIKVTVEPVEGLGTMTLREFAVTDGIAFQTENLDIYLQTGQLTSNNLPVEQLGQWCFRNGFSGTTLDRPVHPRPDIDALLAAQVPEEAPVAETVAFGDLKNHRWCIVDDVLARRAGFVLEPSNRPDKDTIRVGIKFETEVGLITVIMKEKYPDHTIEAADVEITASRVYKEIDA